MKTSELKGVALDWAVAECEDRTIRHDPMGFKKDAPDSSLAGFWIWEEVPSGKGGIVISKSVYMLIGVGYSPSSNWAQGGPIIERERIATLCPTTGDFWDARDTKTFSIKPVYYRGDTPLEAAMRCYVASKLGDEIEIPKEVEK